MNLEQLKEKLPDYAKDIKLNLSTIFSETDTAGLSMAQIAGIALACAYATKQKLLIEVIQEFVKQYLTEMTINGAKAAATIMAMNNIYYRSIHIMTDHEYSKMPAKLRMNIIGNPGIEKTDFELYSFAVSAINGCGMCLDAHNNTLQKHQIDREAIQYCLRIAAIINAVAQVIAIENF